MSGDKPTDGELFAWLLSLPPVKAQAYFWNYGSQSQRRKAMANDLMAARKTEAQFDYGDFV